MKKKYLYPSIIGSALAAVILIYSVNVMAYGEKTDKSHKVQREYSTDRTLIKKVIANQERTHVLLNEIKASLRRPR